MQKHIISLLCALSFSISAPVFAQVSVKNGAPERYTVQSGDTLWSISKQYLNQPWQWPELWNNNQSIKNPNKIYPGQTLILTYIDGKPRLGVAKTSGNIPVIKLTPQIRDVSSGYGIKTIDVDFYRMFMAYPQILPINETLKAPKILAGPENRYLYNRGDRLYTTGLTKPGRYYTYRFTKDILDPDTNKLLGREVIISGIVSTLATTSDALDNQSKQDANELPNGEYYTRLHPLVKVPTSSAQAIVVEESVSEISQGDFLLPIEKGNNNAMVIMPHAPDRPVNAKVVSIVDGVVESGPFQSITLNKGLDDGLDVGSVVSLYKKSRQIKSGISAKKTRDGKTISTPMVKYLSIPAEEVGLAMVYRSHGNLSYAIILESVTNINIGDTAREPGLDLDDFKQDSKHSPNSPPETPHGWKYNQFNSTDPYDSSHL